MCSLNFLDTPAIDDGLVMAFKHVGIVCPSRYNSSSFSFYRCFKRRCKISRWSIAFEFQEGFCGWHQHKVLTRQCTSMGNHEPDHLASWLFPQYTFSPFKPNGKRKFFTPKYKYIIYCSYGVIGDIVICLQPKIFLCL